MTTILGVIAAVCFLISGLPLVREVHKAPILTGFSRVGWATLLVALIAITWQLFILDASIIVLTAQVFNTFVVGYVAIQVFRKG